MTLSAQHGAQVIETQLLWGTAEVRVGHHCEMESTSMEPFGQLASIRLHISWAGCVGTAYYLARSRRGPARLRVSLIALGIALFGFAISHLGAVAAFIVVANRTAPDQARTSDTYEITANDLEICTAAVKLQIQPDSPVMMMADTDRVDLHDGRTAGNQT